ncbi:YidH family protein [Stutzerimonas urumqiensis]|uniref:YidH family protein n=1 Tax=Stutzerimonas urumqiensis TaxID=638269 RepID=UPI000EB1C6B6|nr:DUF202 domain-containing protein [Stutzerimonas urumqiensis]
MSDETRRGRHPRPAPVRLLLGGGEEPDPRFTLANERTYLAWTRTALALLGGAIALESFAVGVFSAAQRTLLVIGLLLLSAVLSIGACWRWLSIERALRQSAPLPVPLLVPVLSVGTIAGAALTLRWLLP